MKGYWIAVLLCAGALLVLVPAFMTDPLHDTLFPSRTGDSPLQDGGQRAVAGLHPDHNDTKEATRTTIFSKYVSPGTRYIVVSLYSGDPADPVSATIITPDKALGPYYDDSDGSINGRIDLKISTPENLTPGLWKFLIHSNRNVSYGSLENLSWVRTGTDDHNADE